VLALARKEADRFHHNYVGTEHLLLGLVRLGQGVAVNVLLKLGLDLETLRLEVEKQTHPGPDRNPSGNIPYTPRVKKVLALAGKEAKALNHSYVGTEHILLGLLREEEGVAARVLKTLEVDLERTHNEVLKERDPNFIAGPSFPTYQDINRIGKELVSPKDRPADVGSASYGQESSSATPSAFHAGTSKEPGPLGSILHPHLARGEILLWSGRPTPKLRLGPQHLPLLFFLLPFLAFLLIPLVGVLNSHSSDQTKSTAATVATTSGNPADATPPHRETRGEKIFMIIFFSLFFGGFAGVMAYSLGGRFLLDRFQLSHTVYGLTNHRIMVITGKTKKAIRSHLLGTATDIRMEQWPDGLGTISFGPNPLWPYATTGFSAQTALKLENIPDAANVFQIISQTRNAR